MTSYPYLIIGAGIAGVSAAEAIRSRDASAGIGIVAAESHLPYSRVLLPSYLKGRIKREQVFIRKREDFEKNSIDFLPGRTVSSVDVAARRLELADGTEIGYGTLLIAAGGSPRPWYHEGTRDRIFRLQTLDDADRLRDALGTISHPVVVGSSFIALEFIETFVLHGVAPRVLIRGRHFFDGILDAEGAAILHDTMTSRGVTVHYGEEVISAEQSGTVVRLGTRHAGVMEADAVAVGIGIKRNSEWLASAGILGDAGGVRTDAYLETKIPGVFAAGDIAEYFDTLVGRHRMIGNWTHAVLQGTRAGLNMAGERAPFSAVPAYSIVNLGLHIAAVGECGGGLEAVSRCDPEARQYERFFLRDGALAGAFLINRFADKAHIAELIAKRIPLDTHLARLKDMSFDIRDISSIL